MTTHRLVAMANQIARFFASQPRQNAVAGISEHLTLFWNPVMLRDLIEILDASVEGVDPLILDAVGRFRKDK